ncbi:peroxiredoxin [Brevibacterium sanguinis]|uniref:Peroxiredoxin n=2 Tax=Brevibacterium TaxID=1696 RepID=A0A366II62_9MICO|nr:MULTISPECIES: redoxin domain-containing protein [Brevibacterium]RBP64165.1 peroxiredoxin [Brevibacterium sanguinis]RBP71543.1 peroxiredoxin [Brevibacterium celere]
MILVPGDRAPGFRVPDQFGSVLDLAEVRQRSTVLVAFLPFAFSPVCGDEIRSLQSLHEELGEKAAPIEIIGITADSKYTLAAWSETAGVTFRLGSDFWPHGEVARSFGVFDDGHGVAERGVFVVSTAGTIVSSRRVARTQVRDFHIDIAEAMSAAERG